jgi:putative methyltransferase (TIGR04325 family)
MPLRRILPSKIKASLRRLVSQPEFAGDYPSWSAASRAAKGFDVRQIADKVRSATLKVRDGSAAYERDSVCFQKEKFWWPLLAAFLSIAAKNGGRLHVADFGGSLGSFYLQHRKFLDQVSDLKWSIVEQEDYVKLGQQEFQDERLKFFYTLDECAERSTIDVVLFSGSLQYLDDPFGFLARAADLSNVLIIDRTPFIDRETDRVAIQSPPRTIYRGSFPHWFFSERKFANFMSGLGLRPFAEWPGFDHQANIKSQYRGRIYVAASEVSSNKMPGMLPAVG